MNALDEVPLRNLGDMPRSGDHGAVALIDCSGEAPEAWTFARLDEAASAAARSLLARGAKRGERVGVTGANSAAWMAAFLGCLRAGCAAVPVAPRLPAPWVEHIIRDAEIRLVFADAGQALPAQAEAVPFEKGEAAQRSGPSFASVVPDPDELAMILYTSGSTSRPKGVMLHHAGQCWALRVRKATVPAPADAARYIAAAPLAHMNALFATSLSLHTGATMVLMPSFRAADFLAAIVRHEVTAVTSVPTMMARVLSEPALRAADTSRVTRVSMGSAPQTETLHARLRAAFPNAEIVNAYGTTEAGPAAFGPHPAGLTRPPMSIGWPNPEGEVRLTAARPSGEGVLHMRNPSVMRGYLNRPELTEAVLEDGWFKTSDLVRADADGFFFFIGRADDMFVCGGENVYPGQVEQILETHPGIASAVVVPRPDEERGAVPVAFVTARPGAALDPDDVKSHSLAHAPAQLHPRHIVICDALPMLANGKIDRRALTDLAGRGAP